MVIQQCFHQLMKWSTSNLRNQWGSTMCLRDTNANGEMFSPFGLIEDCEHESITCFYCLVTVTMN